MHGHALVKGQSCEAGWRPRWRLAYSGRAAEERFVIHPIMAAVLQADDRQHKHVCEVIITPRPPTPYHGWQKPCKRHLHP